LYFEFDITENKDHFMLSNLKFKWYNYSTFAFLLKAHPKSIIDMVLYTPGILSIFS